MPECAGRVVDEQAAILVWTGPPPAAEPGIRHQAEAERRLHTVLLAVMALLQREQRVTYRTLRQVTRGVVDAIEMKRHPMRQGRTGAARAGSGRESRATGVPGGIGGQAISAPASDFCFMFASRRNNRHDGPVFEPFLLLFE
jgi:hypothetical protein